MAGDWIKMRIDLHTSPKVVRISSALKTDRLRTVGALHAIWGIFDSHSEDGNLDGYSPEILDSMIGFEGFCAELIKCEWLLVSGDSLCMPRFDEHNGKSAKKRAMDSERKRVVRKMSASETDKSGTREEKRREDIKTLSSSGDDRHHPDYKSIVDIYHKTLPNLSPVKLLTDKRKSSIRSCSSLKPTYSSLEFWEAYFNDASKSDFLMGRKIDWKADFDFLITKSKFVKVLEGSYD
jgi:hypothetical protein